MRSVGAGRIERVTVDTGDERPLLEIIVTVPWRRMGSTRSIFSAWLFRRKTVRVWWCVVVLFVL